MSTDIILIVLAVLCALVGIWGSIIPGIPGPPISWVGVLLIFICNQQQVSLSSLIITGLLAVIITILDFVVPAWGTKKFGGTKAGSWGSIIGLLVSIFVLPWLGITLGPFGIVGILAGPFFGAYIGEVSWGNKDGAWKAAFGSFVGFLTGTLMKLFYGIAIAILICYDSFKIIF